MLKGVPKIITPELLKILDEMGHGDTICIGDANFPSETNGKRVVRMDAASGKEVLDAVLKLIPLDTYSDNNFYLMNTTNGDPTPTIWAEYEKIAKANDDNYRQGFYDRFEFYDRAKECYCVIATGETAIYANIIIKKGVIK